ncbi:hypothetical protein ACPA9J_27105 [Pseudomonas aeruginosa]
MKKAAVFGGRRRRRISLRGSTSSDLVQRRHNREAITVIADPERGSSAPATAGPTSTAG